MRLGKHILLPIITEKTFSKSEQGVYGFKVSMNATKGSIKEEIKKLYNVDAVDVNMSILPGKRKRIMGSRNFTKTTKSKKAIVKLKEGQKIDIFPKE